MATTDELIMKINGEDYHEDLQFIIDENLRTIAIPKDGVVLGVCGDKDINRVNFRMNRHYNGFDLSTFSIRINYINSNDEPNYFVVTDIQADVDYITFTWLVDAYATKYVGEVSFCVRLFTESEGKIDSQFFSTIGKVSILEGIQVDSMIPEAEVYDLITRISSDVEDKIQTKADAAIASIPADYTTLSNNVDELKGDLENINLGEISPNKFNKEDLNDVYGYYNIMWNEEGTEILGLNEYGYTENYTFDTSGGYFILSNLIPVKSGQLIRRFRDGIGEVGFSTNNITYYDINKNVIGVNPTINVNNVNWIENGNALKIPNDSRIAYIRVPVNDSQLDIICITVDHPADKYYPYINADNIKNNVRKLKDDINSLKEYITNENQWNGKTWYAYGTSLTNTDNEGKYAKYVEQFSGMIRVNKGISGGGICSNTNIKNAVMNTTDGKLDADLITLEVCANDTGATIGSIYDTGDNTFCGALNQCIRYLQENTNAQIVVISSTNARYMVGDNTDKYTPERTFGTDNHTKFDQWEACRKVCALNSVPYIPMGESAGLGYARMNASNKYNVDQIHHTELAGYNLGMFVWNHLKNIPLWNSELHSK